MPKAGPFQAHPQRYDAWFDEHEPAYITELLALRPFVPWGGEGLEIGVGSARFAAPLGVGVGVDPAPAMLARAAERGIEPVEGIAEDLPFPAAAFDHALVVTTLCFVDSPARMVAEAHRVLHPGGRLVIGFIDRESELGRQYEARRTESVFYREARFHSAGETKRLLEEHGFAIEDWGQTLTGSLSEDGEIEPLRPGRGEGAFVVVAAARRESGAHDTGDPWSPFRR